MSDPTFQMQDPLDKLCQVRLASVSSLHKWGVVCLLFWRWLQLVYVWAAANQEELKHKAKPRAKRMVGKKCMDEICQLSQYKMRKSSKFHKVERMDTVGVEEKLHRGKTKRKTEKKP